MRDGFRRGHHAEDRLSAFLDDELADDEALAVARHVSDCATCLAELDEIRTARAALRRLPKVEPPAALFLDAAAMASGGDTLRWPLSLRLLAASLAGSTLVVGAAFAAGGDDEGTVVPPVELFVVDHVVRVGGGPVITPVDLGPGRR